MTTIVRKICLVVNLCMVVFITQVCCEYKIVCYFSNWSQYRKLPYSFTVDDVDPRLCTHVVLAFAKINDVSMDLEFIEYNDDVTYTKLELLKLQRPQLKTLIAIGGYGLLSVPFSKMTSLPEFRESFINQSVAFVTKHGFDGLDLDWEYPTYQTIPNGKRNLDEREFYTKLLEEMKPRFEEAGLLLSAAVPAGIQLIDQGYDVPVLNRYLDFVSLMSYDLNGPWNSVTGHPIPLDSQDNKNVKKAAEHWISKGLDKSKLLIGLSTYARTFNLASQSETSIGSPVDGAGTHGQYTGEQGIMAYYEVCSVLTDPRSAYRRHWLEDQSVPFLEDGNNWIGYEDERSIKLKLDWIKKSGFGGAMIWTLDMDDFPGECKTTIEPYPLLSLIRDELQAQPGSPGEPCLSDVTNSDFYCTDINAVCDLSTTQCRCKEGYREHRKTCKRVIDPGNQCFSTNDICNNGSACDRWQQRCLCTGATFSFNKKCLQKGKLHEDCIFEVGRESCVGDLTTCLEDGKCGCVRDASDLNGDGICIKDMETGGRCKPDVNKCTKYVDRCICSNGTCSCTKFGFCEYQMDGFFADPDDCRRYYRCVGRETFHLRCSAGLFWNNDLKICAFNAQHCGIDSLPPPTTAPERTAVPTPIRTSRGPSRVTQQKTTLREDKETISKTPPVGNKPPPNEGLQNGQGVINAGSHVVGKGTYRSHTPSLHLHSYLYFLIACTSMFLLQKAEFKF